LDFDVSVDNKTALRQAPIAGLQGRGALQLYDNGIRHFCTSGLKSDVRFLILSAQNLR